MAARPVSAGVVWCAPVGAVRPLYFLALMFLWLWAGPAAAAPDGRDKTLVAVRVKAGPVIDGRLDDAVWKGARVDSRFTQQFPDEGSAPTEATDVYVIYDDRALYVGVRCHDRHPEKIVERLTRRDRDTDADKVTIDIDSRGDHLSAFYISNVETYLYGDKASQFVRNVNRLPRDAHSVLIRSTFSNSVSRSEIQSASQFLAQYRP